MPRPHENHTITFLHAVYSPKGGIEGLIAELDEQRVQLTIHHQPRLSEMVASMDEGDELIVELEAEGPNDKGDPDFPLYRLVAVRRRGRGIGRVR